MVIIFILLIGYRLPTNKRGKLNIHHFQLQENGQYLLDLAFVNDKGYKTV